MCAYLISSANRDCTETEGLVLRADYQTDLNHQRHVHKPAMMRGRCRQEACHTMVLALSMTWLAY